MQSTPKINHRNFFTVFLQHSHYVAKTYFCNIPIMLLKHIADTLPITFMQADKITRCGNVTTTLPEYVNGEIATFWQRCHNVILPGGKAWMSRCARIIFFGAFIIQ